MKPTLSSHPEFDDARHWEFTRNSRLPYGTFRSGRVTADFWVVAASVACLAVALIWG